MKRIILIAAIVMATAFGAFAQSQVKSANEFYVGYSFVRQDVKFETPIFRFNENTDSHGVVASYTRYTSKTSPVGITGEVGANFDSNKASLVTALGGITLKARNVKWIQPSVKFLAGAARLNVDRHNIFNPSDVSGAYSAGVGLDFNTRSADTFGVHVGLDYINIGFNSQRQNAVRFTTGLVF